VFWKGKKIFKKIIIPVVGVLALDDHKEILEKG